MRREEEREPGRELVEGQAGRHRRIGVGDGIGDGEGDLLRRRRAGLAHVVATDADRVECRQLGCAIGEGIGHQSHRRLRREDVGAAGDVLLEDVVLDRASEPLGVAPLPSRDGLVQRQQDRRGGVDGHRAAHAIEGNLRKQQLHVGDAVDGDANTPDLAHDHRIVRVVAHLSGQVEGHR